MSPVKFLSLIAISVLLLSLVAAKKKDTAPNADESGEKESRIERFYKKKDLQRITELMAEISELQKFLSEEHTFLSELLISSLSMPKPEVNKVDDLLSSSRNVTKGLERFYSKNTLTGRPMKMVNKHYAKFNSNKASEPTGEQGE
ncbi:uncharacterized protein LOC142349230 [Convolutriloba macropyga]|uniref:uncharacterized protein LOC142349230 n=1 Tax=Convolutriloba macropyga TaxID=536237 RepID=UPI003F521E77